MTSSAAGRPVLTAEQMLELNYLKLTWDRFYMPRAAANGPAGGSREPRARRTSLPPRSKAVLSREGRTALIWPRFHWGQEYAVNLHGSIWTAVPLPDPWLVLSEPTAAQLRATMFLDAAARRMRSGATGARWAGFTSPAPEQDKPPSQADGHPAPPSAPA